MPLHVAFLRGVGGPRPTPGDELRRCFAAAGYDRITPVIATGNVVFGLGRKRKVPPAEALAAMLEVHFGYPLPVVLRSGVEVAAMLADDPFRGLDAARLTRFVAMLADDAPPADALPYPAPDAGYLLAGRHHRDIFIAIDRDRIRTVDVMAVLDRTFRKRVTTRNWNTMEKIAAVLSRVDATPPRRKHRSRGATHTAR